MNCLHSTVRIGILKLRNRWLEDRVEARSNEAAVIIRQEMMVTWTRLIAEEKK